MAKNLGTKEGQDQLDKINRWFWEDDRFLRGYSQEGMVIGFISAAIATGVLALLYHAGVGVIERIGLGIQAIPFTSILLPMVLAFIAVGVLVGFFGGFISIRKYLKKEGNEILGW